MPKFILKFGAAVIKEIPFPDDIGTFTLGRKEDNNLPIDNPAVSSHHLQILKEENRFFVEDLNSTNGTFLNGQKIIKAEIHDKDQIRIAMSHTLVFYNEVEQFTVPGMKDIPQSDATVVIDAAQQREILKQMAATKEPTGGTGTEKMGVLKIVDGLVEKEKVELELTKLVSYVGAGQQCDVKIRGLFAPDVAAAINRRPDGYLIKAVRENYPKVNNVPLKLEQLLKQGDLIEVGKTKIMFYLVEKPVNK